MPGAFALLRTPASALSGTFVGVGDPIYNLADPRRARTKASPASARTESTPVVLELPRLYGTGREVDSCAKIWASNGQPAVLLKGADANAANWRKHSAIDPRWFMWPRTCSFPHRRRDREASPSVLQPGNRIELLGDTETAGMRAEMGLVVLDGCSTGKADVLPGAGLMGMTRAWLAAGAHSVISTRWPTSDQESGGIFLSLYRLYFERRSRPALDSERSCERPSLPNCTPAGRVPIPPDGPRTSAWKQIDASREPLTHHGRTVGS